MSASEQTAEPTAKAGWGELFREGRAFFTVLLTLVVALHGLQVTIINVVMPAVVADIGGASYYTWSNMLYTVGSITGAASVGPLFARLGGRKAMILGASVFVAGTAGCGWSPDMTALLAARSFQGLGGGVLLAGGMAFVGKMFPNNLRTRILAVYQGVWLIASLTGPLVGGAFSYIGWWRGAFWSIVPLILLFIALAAWRIPDEVRDAGRAKAGFPLSRLALLATGVLCVGLAGSLDLGMGRWALLAFAVGLVWATFRLDRDAESRLFPSRPLSPASPVGLTFWTVFLVGGSQTAATIFLPLLLQVYHGLNPLLIGAVTFTISVAWTIGTFTVSGWSGRKENMALGAGPVFMVTGLGIMAATADQVLAWQVAGAFVLGLGIGVHHVHLVSRGIAGAIKGEESITASSMPTMRTMGTAFGAAAGGLVANMAGLGSGTEADAVVGAVSTVYLFAIVPMVLAGICIMRIVFRRPAPAEAAPAAG